MKCLTQFVDFDWERFAKDKVLLVTGCVSWDDYDTKAHCGTRVDSVIARDNTAYVTKNGEQCSNLYEKITFKVKKDVNIPINAHIVPVNPVAKVYGEYRNKLTVTCDDIQVVQQAKA